MDRRTIKDSAFRSTVSKKAARLAARAAKRPGLSRKLASGKAIVERRGNGIVIREGADVQVINLGPAVSAKKK